MILANTRHRLTRNDAQLVLQLLAQGSHDELQRAESTLRDHGLDELLDEPRLLSALIERRHGSHASLPLVTYVMSRQALCSVGERDRGVADYVASILLHFSLRQRTERIGEHDDEIYDSLASLLKDAECGDPTRAFMVRAHLGNYALWLSGLFPDYIEERRSRRGGPDLGYYEDLGRRGYELAAEHRLAEQYGMQQLFAVVAERFPRLRVALNRVSDQFLFPHAHSPTRLIRQVQDEARWQPT